VFDSFISRRSHDQVVALYEARLEEHRRREEALGQEVAFYRQAWLDRLGVKFPIPKPAEVTAINPLAPVTFPDELTQRKTFQLDKAEWTEDDHQWYEDYWVKPKLKDRIPPEELEYWYFQEYKNRLPVEAFLDAAYPIS
jgi:hypothetical protein